MGYKVGKYEYRNINHYHRIILRVVLVFIICLFLLFELRADMSLKLFWFTVIVDIFALIHLFLRYLHSIKKIKYIWNNY